MGKISRRDMLKISGLGIGACLAGNALGKAALASGDPKGHQAWHHTFQPGTPLYADEMRITFCGTWYTPRIRQACNSVFVELGSDSGEPRDQFVFDCGSGVVAKYVALGVPYSRMDKIFLTHLHGDHMSDLTTIYCFGPAADRKSALRVWGPSGDTRDEGTRFFCQKLRELAKWHRESFSFLPTGYQGDGDGYDLEAHELPYMRNPGPAYHDHVSGVTISHFPAIHARDGSISYKLEWNGMSMVFTGDTKPNNYVLEHGEGVDILIHEMAAPPDVWTTKETGLRPGDEGYAVALALNTEVIMNSHTLQSAFGYIMSQTRPRLAVATHFPNDPDLIKPALADIRCFYDGHVAIATDLLVITINKEKKIRQAMAVVPDYPWYTAAPLKGPLASPKYHGPLAQFNDRLRANIIPAELYLGCTDRK